MSKFIDFDGDLENSHKNLKKKHSEIKKTKKSIQNDTKEIDSIEEDIAKISQTIGSPLPISSIKSEKANFDWADKFFLDHNPIFLETKIVKEIYQNPKLLPSLSKLEYGLIGLSGVIATTVDFLIVKMPKDVIYLSQYLQKGSKFTSWVRTLGVDKEGNLNAFLSWLEEICKVPYDQSLNSNIEGFHPRTHRLLSLAHDPLLGLIFGLVDILNGRMTAFDIKGKIHFVQTFNLSIKDKIFAPFLWLGHIISDVCTTMGVPIPGWGFLQILQYGSFGDKDRTIADISRWMYLNGYDLRHFITMSISVAVIEIIIRAYHYLSGLENRWQMENSVNASLISKELANVESNLKLHKMLFLAHSVAASGNAMKVFAYSGNPLSINADQWMLFLQKSIKITKAVLRDKVAEKIVRNRRIIDEEWEKIKDIKIGQFELLKQDSTIYYEIFN